MLLTKWTYTVLKYILWQPGPQKEENLVGFVKGDSKNGGKFFFNIVPDLKETEKMMIWEAIFY